MKPSTSVPSVTREPGLDPRGHDLALQTPEQRFLVVQPCNERRVGIILGTDLGQGEAGKIGKLGRLRERRAEPLDDAVQFVGVGFLELDADLVQNEAGGEIQLRLLVRELARYERLAFRAQAEQPEELLLAGGPFRGHNEPQDAALVLGEEQRVPGLHGLRDRVGGVIEPPFGGDGAC